MIPASHAAEVSSAPPPAAPLAAPLEPLAGCFAPAALLPALVGAVEAALTMARIDGAGVASTVGIAPALRLRSSGVELRGPAPARTSRLQVFAGCRDVEGRALTSPIVIGQDRRVPAAWRLSIFVGEPTARLVCAALMRLLLDPLFTGQLRAGAPWSGAPRLGLTHSQVVAYHLAHLLRTPTAPERGRVLWVDANPTVDTVLVPHGLSILNAIAARRGFLGAIVSPFTDFEHPQEDLAAAIARFQPDLLGISLRNIDDAVTIRSGEGAIDAIDTVDALGPVARLVRAVRVSYAGPVVLGGAALARSPGTLMRTLGISHGLQGPGEDAIDALFARWRPHEEASASAAASFVAIWRTIPGALVEEDLAPTGAGRQAPSRPSRALPSPVAPVPRDPAKVRAERRLGVPAALRGSAGCPLDCTYCLEATPRLPFQQRTISAVVDELQWLHEQYGITHFHLTDSEVNLTFARLRALAAEVVRRGLQRATTWTAYCTPHPFDVDAIGELCASGLRRLKISVDHFAPGPLRSLGKVYSEAAVHRLLSALVERPAGLEVAVSILFGAPGETLATIDHALAQIRRYATSRMSFYYNVGLRLYPGTPLFQDWERGRLDDRLCLGPGRADGGISPLVYCAPGPPRLLARKIASALSDVPTVRRLAADRSTTADEALRRLHVAASSWFRGDVDTVERILGGLGVSGSSWRETARAALQLERRLRRS